MADYAPLNLTSSAWTALPTATEATVISIRGGAVLGTNHSAPSGDNGHEFRPGDGYAIKANAAWSFRLAAGQVATIIRTSDA